MCERGREQAERLSIPSGILKIFGSRIKSLRFRTLTGRNGGIFLVWFWTFVCYSFAGFLLEVAFAAAVGGRPDRKGLLVLPLCPVYGLGACLILLLPRWVAVRPWALFLAGGLAATAAEYIDALYHEKVLGVTFWDYRGLPGNIAGRVCLPFSLAWGILSLGLVWWVHPRLLPWLERIPGPVSAAALLTLAADGWVTAVLLRRCGDTRCLRWDRRGG